MAQLTRNSLYAYQLRLIEFIKRNPMCALWVDMGLGKTVATLSAFLDELAAYNTRRMLVAAPKRVARDVWDAEIEQWAHLQGLTVSKICGTREQRLAAYRVPADIHTIGRHHLDWLFRGHFEEVAPKRFRQIRKWPWDWLTLDESQSYKNQEAARSQAARRLRTAGVVDRIVELTGTPASKGYIDLWHQFFIMDGGKRLGYTEDGYKKRWFDPPPDWGYKWTLKEGAREQIQERIQDLVVSMRAEDYLDLPPVLYNPVRVKLSDAAMRAYEKFERSSVLKLDGATITAVNAGVLHGKLLQFAGGSMYTGEGRQHELVHDAKINALADVLEELAFSGPVIIAHRLVSERERIGKFLDKFCGRGQTWAVLKSSASLKSFARGEIDYGVMHPATGGHGLNDLHMSGSENIVHFGPNDDLELWDQINARIAGGHRRMGKNVVVHCLIAQDTADEKSVQMLKDKDVDQVELVKALRGKYA